MRTTQLMQIIIDRYDLLRRVWGSGLLSVTERGIRDPDLMRHMMRDDSIIECDLRNFIVGEQIAKSIRFVHIYELVHVLFQFQKM
jgi:hypothetical protein